MDADTISPTEMGRNLRGIGLNLLSRDVPTLAAFLTETFGVTAHQVSEDFALIAHDGGYLQLHSFGTFSTHPVLSLVPESGVPGGGVQIYLFNCDPDLAVERAEAAGGTIVEHPIDKPHGTREATILSPEGYAFTAAAPLL